MNYALFQVINVEAGRVDGVDDVMEFCAQMLIYVAFGLAAVLVGVAVRRRRWRPVVGLGAALVLAFAGTLVLAHLNGELRPFQTHTVHQLIPHENGVSLPSDHATAAFALAFAVWAFLHRGWGAVLTVLAVIVGVARVWVGVHYPGDIAAGAVIALVAVLLVRAVTVRRRSPRDVRVDLPPADIRVRGS